MPVGKVRAKLCNVAHPPDMVADAVVLHVLRLHPVAGDLLAEYDRLKHRTVAEAAPSHVVRLAGAGGAIEVMECVYEIGAVDIVAHLLPLVSEDPVLLPRHGTLHQ